MSTLFSLCVVTFITAAIFTYINIFNSKKFSNFFFLIFRSGMILLYCGLYGIIGVLLFLLLKESALTIDENATNLSGPYFKAFVVGLTTKGVADIKFFDVKHQGEPFPIGLRSITQFLDMHFDRAFDSICLDKLVRFMRPYQAKYAQTNLALFKQEVMEILSAHPAKEKVAAFATTVMTNAQSTKEILDGILTEFGKRTLETIKGSVNGVLP